MQCVSSYSIFFSLFKKNPDFYQNPSQNFQTEKETIFHIVCVYAPGGI